MLLTNILAVSSSLCVTVYFFSCIFKPIVIFKYFILSKIYVSIKSYI